MKKLLLVVAIMIAALQTFSQTDLVRQKLDSIFQYIDKAQIPTGYLKEYGAELMPIHCFNGVLTDSNAIADIDCFRATYTDISTAKIQSLLPLMTDLTVVNTSIDSLRNITASATPIAILYGSYASLRDDALSLNLFSITNQQIYDVAGRSQSPYLTNTLFAAASINKVFTNTVSFTYKPVLYFTNTNLTITDISVDFRDGQGYKIIPVNGMVSKTYTDSSSTKIIDFKAHLSTGAYVYCHSSVDVYVSSSGMVYSYTGADPYSKQVPVPIVAGEGLGGDTMQIRYSINNPTRTNTTPHLRKPLIYVEGYDVSGKYNILNLISNDLQNPGEWVALSQNYDFMHYLDDIAGYDLVFVNYNTLRSFEDNSNMLQHVIEWVKQDKTAGGYTTQNVIIGTSAGGVLARYTLARMTKTISSVSTDTRLLITHDSPHQGANVPLAFQHFLYDLGNVSVLGKKIKDVKEDLKKFFVLNTLPATAQLLRARVIDENGTVVMNTFLNGSNSPYQQMIAFSITDNKPTYRFIATAQGSQCGVPVMSSNGLPLANYDGDFAIAKLKYLFIIPSPYTSKYFLQTQLTALPANGTSSQIEYFKYSRRFSILGVGFGTRILKEVSRLNPAGFTDWDAAPGSTQSINDRAGGALNTGLTKQKVPWYATPFVTVRAGLTMNVTQDLFSFVSTTSALDAPIGTPLNTPYIFFNTGTSGTTSQKYIAQEKFIVGGNTFYNQNHTDFTARNSQWIYNEMENITQPALGCNDYCGSPSISGSGNLCTSGIYSVANLPPGSSVTWSASPAGIVQFSCTSCTQTTITKLTDGTVVITASFTGNCGNPPVSQQIIVGVPSISGTYTDNSGGHPLKYWTGNTSTDYNPVCVTYYAQTNLSIQGANNTTWSKITSTPVNITWAQTSNDVRFYFWGIDQTALFKVDASNSCGTTSNTFGFKSISCGGGGGCLRFTISPNPAKGVLNVIVPNIPPPCGIASPTDKKSNTQAGITEIKIYDQTGNLQIQKKFDKSKQAVVDILSLKTGVYFVYISDVTIAENQKIIIQN